MVGSGVLLGERLVLTARHVVDVGPTGPRCSARPLPSRPGNDWIDLDLCAVGGGPAGGIALLEFRRRPPLPPADGRVPALGRLDVDESDQGLPCSAVGFPVASVRPDHRRDPSRLLGRVVLRRGVRADELAVTVDTAIASLDDPRDVAWGGMSGAALVAGDHVVGVLARVTTATVGKELAAVPVTRLLEDPEARRLLVGVGAVGADGQVDVVPVPVRLELEHRRSVMLRPPTLRLPLGTDARAHPAQLLDSGHALVDFVPGQALGELQQWCAGPERLSVRSLLGDAGTGKSRLAAQLCQVQEELGWDAGVADEAIPGGRSRHEPAGPTLIVVDDAERRIGLVVALLNRFALARHGPSLRVLLVSRTKQVWWEEVNHATHGLGDVYETPELWLDRLDPLTPDQRKEHLLAALRAFGRELGLPQGRVGALPELVDLEADDYATPLLVHVAALLACLDPWTIPADGEGGPRAQVLAKLLATERRRWNSLRRMDRFGLGGLADISAGEAVAVTTLTAPARDDLTRELVAAVPRLDPDLVTGLVDWLHVAYPSAYPPAYPPAYPGRAAGVAPVRPDALAEQLLGETPTLAALLVELTRLVLGRPSSRRRREAPALPDTIPTLLAGMLWEVTRAAERQRAVRRAVGTLIEEQLPALVRCAVDHPESALAPALVAALRCAPPRTSRSAAAGALDLVNRGGPLLAGLALEVAEQGTAHLAQRADADPADLADRWRQLGVRRARARQRGPAVVAAVRAVRLAAALGPTEPAGIATLARALDSLAERLGEADHPGWALRASTRATDLFTLADRRGGGQRRGERARALTNLADHRAAVGRKVAALAAVARAVKLYEDLPAKDRNELEHAEALDGLGARYADVGDHRREALAAAEASATVLERLYKRQAEQTRPDRRPDAEYRPALADALTTLALRRSALARHERAVEVAHRAAEPRPGRGTPRTADRGADPGSGPDRSRDGDVRGEATRRGPGARTRGRRPVRGTGVRRGRGPPAGARSRPHLRGRGARPRGRRSGRA